MSYFKAFGFIAFVFIVNLILMFTGVSERFESVDIPLHFFGGFAWSVLVLVWLKDLGQEFKYSWLQMLFCIGIVLVVGTVWEFAEYGLELIVGQHDLLTPLTLRDTLADLFNDSLGAALAWAIFRNKI